VKAWLAPLAVAATLSLACAACTPQGDPSIGSEGFHDAFDRRDLGPLWTNTGGNYQIRDGHLWVRGARNKPLWLRRRLPRDARIELVAQSASPDGDIKFEVWGDGTSKAETVSYTATSYVVILGGWSNTLNVLARMNEHGEDRVVGPRMHIEPNHPYHVKVERRGSVVTVWVDDRQLMRMDDPDPLEGRGHEYFGINDWDAELSFDDLRITPL